MFQFLRSICLALVLAMPVLAPGGGAASHGLYYLERCYVNAFAQSYAQHPVIGAGQFFVNQKKVGVVLGLGMPGKQNPLLLNSAKEWVKILPNARLLRIPRFGHLPFVEQPDIFYPAVEQILER